MTSIITKEEALKILKDPDSKIALDEAQKIEYHQQSEQSISLPGYFYFNPPGNAAAECEEA